METLRFVNINKSNINTVNTVKKEKKISTKNVEKYNFFRPRNDNQVIYKELLTREKPHIVISTGPAGTSKTFGATMVGLEKLRKKEIKKLVITRPAVAADEDLGFLPGMLEDKMKAWLLPIFDNLSQYLTKEEIKKLMEEEDIEICSLSHMRGRTFCDSFVIVDECQNTTPSQMLMLLTRIGCNSKFVLTGDPQQHDKATLFDLKNNNMYDMYKKNKSGLVDLIEKMNTKNMSNSEYLYLHTFEKEDIERHEAIPFVLDLYDP